MEEPAALAGDAVANIVAAVAQMAAAPTATRCWIVLFDIGIPLSRVLRTPPHGEAEAIVGRHGTGKRGRLFGEMGDFTADSLREWAF